MNRQLHKLLVCTTLLIASISSIAQTPPGNNCGNALYLNGRNQFVNANVLAQGISDQSITIEMWFNTSSSGLGTFFAINTSTGGNAALIVLRDGKVAVFDGVSGQDEITTATNVNDGNWHHLAYSSDNNRIGSLYLDGNLVGTHAIDFTLSTQDQYSIGQEFDGANNSDFFEGFIDEVRIWSKARTGQEIAGDYTQALLGTETGLLGYYMFNSLAAPSLVIDQTPNVNDLTAINDDAATFNNIVRRGNQEQAVTFGDSVLVAGMYQKLPGVYIDTVLTGGSCDSISMVSLSVPSAQPVGDECATVLDFDGQNDWVEVNTLSSEMAIVQDFTIEFWFNTNTTNSAMNFVAANTSTGSNVLLIRKEATGKFVIFDGGGSGSVDITSLNEYENNTWHHLAYVREGSEGRLYINGNLEGTHIAGYTLAASDQWSLGQEFDGSNASDFLDGQMDEMRIWSESRSIEKILSTATEELTGVESNLLAYFDFNEGVGETIQDQVQGLNGNFVNMNPATAWTLTNGDAPCLTLPNEDCGTVLNFDGVDDFVAINGVTSGLNSNEFTVEFWTKFNANDNNPGINGGTSLLSIHSSTAANKLRIQTGNNGNALRIDDLASGSNIGDGEWHHVAVVSDGSQYAVYVDGTLDFTKNQTATFVASDVASIGQEYDGPGLTASDFFKGQMDEVRVWNSARTNQEIRSTASIELTGSETGLVAYYNFNDGAFSDTLYDFNNSQYDGVLINMDTESAWTLPDGSAGGNSNAFIEVSACERYVSPSGAAYVESGRYIDFIDNQYGCDSIITIDLMIQENQEVGIIAAGPELTASIGSGDSLTWINCGTGDSLAGGTVFLAEEAGSYAVIFTNGACMDTSDCETILITSVMENTFSSTVSIYPNPTKESVLIDLGDTYSKVRVELRSANAELISSEERIAVNEFYLDINGNSGLYFLSILDENGKNANFKILKQ